MNMTPSSSLADRLKIAMTARKLKQAQLSKLVGEVSGLPISQVAIQKITSGQTQHSKRLPDIARALGVSVEWLAYGSDDSRFPDTGTTLVPVGRTTALSSNTDMEERVIRRGTVPVIGIAKLGTDGYFEIEGYAKGSLRIHSDDPDAYGLRIKGHTMSPRIKHNEFVLVEPNQELVAFEEVLVKTVEGLWMIKIFARCEDGFYRFDSVNEDVGPIYLAAEEIAEIHFVGGILKSTRYFEP